jgi:hypothetical protein
MADVDRIWLGSLPLMDACGEQDGNGRLAVRDDFESGYRPAFVGMPAEPEPRAILRKSGFQSIEGGVECR